MSGLPAVASCPAWLGDLLEERGLPDTHVWKRGVGIGLLDEMSRGDRIIREIKISVKQCRAKWIV